jgi:hypothetical protein
VLGTSGPNGSDPGNRDRQAFTRLRGQSGSNVVAYPLSRADGNEFLEPLL